MIIEKSPCYEMINAIETNKYPPKLQAVVLEVLRDVKRELSYMQGVKNIEFLKKIISQFRDTVKNFLEEKNSERDTIEKIYETRRALLRG